MAREIDEGWIDEAIDRYRRLDQLRAEFDKVVASHSVSVHSPDDTIEVVVTAAGEITEVRITGSLHQRSAAEAARWARAKLHGEIFGKLKED